MCLVLQIEVKAHDQLNHSNALIYYDVCANCEKLKA